jgi:hypothetical protein
MARTYGKAQDLIDFTRASSGTALRRVKYGAELVTNGTFDSDTTGWTSSNAILSVNNGEIVITNDGAVYGFAFQELQTEVGKVYQYSIDVNYTGDPARVRIGTTWNGDQIYEELNIAQDKTIVVNFVALTTTTYVRIGLQANVDGHSSNFDNVSVKEVTFDTSDGDLVLFNHPNNIPRIEYDADGSLLGLLVEESRTNSISYSDFTSGWGETTFSGISSSGLRYLQLNAGIAPDGTNTAVKAYASTNSDQQRLYFSAGLGNAQYTFSVYAKAAEYTTIAIRHDTGNGESIVVDLTDGSLIGTTTPEAYSITDVGNGWYRISITDTDTDASGVPWIQLLNDLGAETFAGDGVSGVYIWGPQAEAGSFPTSYIPTSGSTATRSADVASIATSGFGYRQDEGTFALKATPYDASSLVWFAAFGSGASDSIQFYTSVSKVRTFIRDGGVDQAKFNTIDSISDNTEFSFASGFKQNDISSVVDGGTIASDTSASIPNISAVLNIGVSTNGGSQLNGHIKSIKYYPRRLTNAQLQELTL